MKKRDQHIIYSSGFYFEKTCQNGLSITNYVMRIFLFFILFLSITSCGTSFHNKKYQRGYWYGQKKQLENSDMAIVHYEFRNASSGEEKDVSHELLSQDEQFEFSNLHDDKLENSVAVEEETITTKPNVDDGGAEKTYTIWNRIGKVASDNDFEQEASSDSKIAFGLFLGAIAVGTIALTVSSVSHMLVPLIAAAFLLSIMALILAAKARRKTSLPNRRINMGLIMVFSALIGGALLVILGFSILALL